MTEQAFIDAINALEGLTDAMKESLIAMAPKMSEQDRTDALAKLSEANTGIVNALTEQAEIYKQAGQELHTAERAMKKEEEGAERGDESKAADDLLSNM